MFKEATEVDVLEACRFTIASVPLYFLAICCLALYFIEIDGILISDLLIDTARGTMFLGFVDALNIGSIAGFGLSVALAPIQLLLAVFKPKSSN